jgi:hypothetical protein
LVLWGVPTVKQSRTCCTCQKERTGEKACME